ncbi:hypothetical protein [Candidatus Poriferisodalis sp.]|uniref:hypothetical protein n=1 Tax=Candidatus Poriferisodalis sp. TaxID=3101277 RepID=UPI003B017460
MTDGEQDADGDLAPDKPEQAQAPVPQVSFNQFNQQIQLIFPSMIEALSGLADKHPALADKIVGDIAAQGLRQDEMTMVVVKGNDRRADRGQRAAQIVGLLILAFGAFLIATDRPVEGYIALAVVVAPYLGVVIWRSRAAAHERIVRAQQMLNPPNES